MPEVPYWEWYDWLLGGLLITLWLLIIVAAAITGSVAVGL